MTRNFITYLGVYKEYGTRTEELTQQRMPVGGTLTNLSIQLNADLDDTDDDVFYRFRARKNGMDTSLLCNVTETFGSCSNNVVCVDYAAGDLISLEVCPSGEDGCPGTNPTGGNSREGNWIAVFTAGATCL